jgi:hypothetical protein
MYVGECEYTFISKIGDVKFYLLHN